MGKYFGGGGSPGGTQTYRTPGIGTGPLNMQF
jgi:hypothetical protein